MAEGLPAKVIAARLGIAEATVRNHIRAILVALGTHSQLEAIARAVVCGSSNSAQHSLGDRLRTTADQVGLAHGYGQASPLTPNGRHGRPPTDACAE
jgi:Bacterial regulatory proteins, luxR family